MSSSYIGPPSYFQHSKVRNWSAVRKVSLEEIKAEKLDPSPEMLVFGSNSSVGNQSPFRNLQPIGKYR